MRFATAGIMIVAALSSFPAVADPNAGAQKPVFSCQLGTKTVRVEAVGNQLIYHYGTIAKDEMIIVGDMQSGNPKYYSRSSHDFYEEQIRFSNGPYSYIISAGTARNSEATSSAGMIVAKGTKVLSDKQCAKATTFKKDLSALPQDDDSFDALAMG